MTTTETIVTTVLVCLMFATLVSLHACESGIADGYWHGCVAGSDGKRQPVLVDGARKCLPHEQAKGLRK